MSVDPTRSFGCVDNVFLCFFPIWSFLLFCDFNQVAVTWGDPDRGTEGCWDYGRVCGVSANGTLLPDAENRRADLEKEGRKRVKTEKRQSTNGASVEEGSPRWNGAIRYTVVSL